MKQFLKLYLTSAVFFLVVDLVWLVLIMPQMYQQYLGHLMGQVRIIPGIIFYLLYLAGVVVFVVKPCLAKGGLTRVLALGAFFGLICYATYDLTNLATLADWPLMITVIDLIWGTSITAATAGFTYQVGRYFLWG